MHWSRTLAIELATDKIRVNAIAPAVIETPVYDTFLTPEQVKDAGTGQRGATNLQYVPSLGRNGQVANVAEALLFLLRIRRASSPASCCRSTAASWPAAIDGRWLRGPGYTDYPNYEAIEPLVRGRVRANRTRS